MTGATHRLGGIIAGAAVIAHTDLAQSGMIFAGALLGSLLPDIDNKNSSISRRWSLMSVLVSLGQKVIRGVAWMFPDKQKEYIRSLIGHRGLSHSLLAMCFLPGVLLVIMRDLKLNEYGSGLALGMAIGIGSHLLLDMLSGGVPLFMPFITRRIALLHIKTGGAAEWLVRLLLISVLIYMGMEEMLWQRLLHV